MKNNKFAVPLLLALAWIFIKLLTQQLNLPSPMKIGIYSNLLLILLVALGALHQKVKREKKLESYGSNFKFCLRQTGVYLIIVTAFIFMNYSYINPSYLKNQERESINRELAQDYKEIQKQNPVWKDVPKAEYENRIRESAKMLSSVSFNTSIHFLGIFLICVLYSIFTPIFYKKVILQL